MPAIEQATFAADDLRLRCVLLDALGHIGDPRAVPTLERFTLASDDESCRRAMLAIARTSGTAARRLLEHGAESPDATIRSAAIAALVRLGSIRDLDVLRALRRRGEPARRIEILEALDRAGADDVFAEVVQIGLDHAELHYRAAEILVRRAPLRRALGIPDGEDSVVDSTQLLRAADEWYREHVLGEPSPWHSSPASVHGEPFARAKQAAWTQLLANLAAHDDEFCCLRVRPGPPRAATADPTPPLTLVRGNGHGHTLRVDVWQPRDDASLCTSFDYRSGAVVVTNRAMPRQAYAALVAALRTVLDARLMQWWSGPAFGFSHSSGNFAIAIAGLDGAEAPTRRYCGYPGSGDRENYELLCAAQDYYDEAVAAQAAGPTDAEVTPAVRAQFAAVFRAERQTWAWYDSWWWVREDMVEMARDLGDASLVAPLRDYLAPQFVAGGSGKTRTAAAAVAALAALTGQDLRRAADGSERPLAEVAAAYEALLAQHR